MTQTPPPPGSYPPPGAYPPAGAWQGQPQYGYAEPHRGTLILVLGILGVVVCFICGIFAWSMGNADLAKMAAGQMDPSGRDTTQAGRICGIIGTILGLIGCGLGLIYVIVIIGLVSSGNLR